MSSYLVYNHLYWVSIKLEVLNICCLFKLLSNLCESLKNNIWPFLLNLHKPLIAIKISWIWEMIRFVIKFQKLSAAYSESCQTSKMERFVKIVDGRWLFSLNAPSCINERALHTPLALEKSFFRCFRFSLMGNLVWTFTLHFFPNNGMT